jgi:hypothetical protein
MTSVDLKLWTEDLAQDIAEQAVMLAVILILVRGLSCLRSLLSSSGAEVAHNRPTTGTLQAIGTSARRPHSEVCLPQRLLAVSLNRAVL